MHAKSSVQRLAYVLLLVVGLVLGWSGEVLARRLYPQPQGYLVEISSIQHEDGSFSVNLVITANDGPVAKDTYLDMSPWMPVPEGYRMEAPTFLIPAGEATTSGTVLFIREEEEEEEENEEDAGGSQPTPRTTQTTPTQEDDGGSQPTPQTTQTTPTQEDDGGSQPTPKTTQTTPTQEDDGGSQATPKTTQLTPTQEPNTLTRSSGDGQEGPTSTQLAEPFVVSVLDQDDSPLAGVAVTFSVAAGGGLLATTSDANPCTFEPSTSSTTATTDANGRALTYLTLGSDVGTNTVAVAVEGLEPVTFTATAAEQAMPHHLTKVCGEDQEGTVGALLAKPFVVSVVDEDGTATAGVAVSFAVTAGGGTLTSATATTNANGRARTYLTLGSELGTNTVSAAVEGLEPVIFTAVGQEDPLASMFNAFFGSGKLVALPDRTQLLQNAPNPFNSQTVLSYFLPESGSVRLELFSLTGQRVAVLHQGPQEAGYHRLHWDGRDDAGHSVASGTYLYRLVTAEDVLTRKLILLR